MSIFKHRLFLISVFALLAIIFLFLSWEVYQGDIFSFDKQTFLWTHSHENSAVTTFALACTFLGSQTFLLPANVLLAAFFLFINKQRKYVWKIAVVSLTSAGFLFLVKYIIKRPRPETPLLDAALHYSFPSGHTFTSITFFGMVLYFAMKSIKGLWARIFIVALGMAVVLSIAWSRVYLHVHYASDVLAGFCLGLMWLIMAKWFLLDKEKFNPR